MSGDPRTLTLGVEVVASRDPVAAAALAVDAERLGYDRVLVTTDGDGAADPWTLAAWVAGRTDRIGVAATGLDLSMRQPTVLGRMAGSLDLLASGRLTVGLSPGQAVADLAEAVTVVRRMWDTSTPRVHHHGRLRVAGAEPGPMPAHDIRVWLGGDDAATVELAGRVADGWVGRLDASGPEPLVDRLRLLGTAVERAGRDPRELDRVVVVPGRLTAPGTPAGGFLDGPAERWVDDLAPLVVGHGVTSFVLRVEVSEGSGPLERFAHEVAPGLHEAASRALAAGVVAPVPVRRLEVRARRLPGIDYDGLPRSLAGTAVEPGDVRYPAVRSTYLRGGSPGLVLRPQTPAEVVDAVAFARRHRHVPLGVRSGGHGISGRSTNDGGLVIDVGALDGIEVLDESRRLVRVGPGARWRQVATTLQPFGWALGSGDHGGVGVGGLATAGGIGFLGRKHGLTIDHLLAVELVLADGSLVRADDIENAELFWAVRGAGANFGIATAFEFVVDEVTDVGWAQLAFEVDDPASFLVEFGRVATAAPRETTPFLIMGGSGVAQVMAMVASDDPDVVVSQLQPFALIAPLVQQQVVIAPYAAVMSMVPETPHDGRGEPVARSGVVTGLTPEVAAAGARLLTSRAASWFQLRTMGGAVADVAPDATAFPHRDAAFQITALGASARRLDREWDRLRPHLSGLYLSFETDTSPERLVEAFGPSTLTRLRTLKARLDPTNLFRDNFNLVTDSRRTA